MELKPFCTCPKTLLLVEAHQSSNDLSPACGARACRPRFCRTLNHTCLLKTQDTSKWSMVSPSWSQRGQAAGWERPFLASLSAVQHFLCATVHIKNLHLPGAQLCQILSQRGKKNDTSKEGIICWLCRESTHCGKLPDMCNRRGVSNFGLVYQQAVV